jgi:Cu(I)/Ag(I) efflux system membrane fusion protein
MKSSSRSAFMLVVLIALIATPAAAVDEFGEDAATIEISADQQKLIGVKTVVAAVTPLHRTIRTIGRIEYDERGLATINTKIEGWIEKLHVNYTGDYVKKGVPVAEIYSPELYATQQEFLNVLEWTGKKPVGSGDRKPYYKREADFPDLLARDAQAMVKAARQRLKLWDISDAQIDKIEKTGTPVRTLTIYSPASGYVVQKAAIQGMRVMPGEKLVDIVDLSTLWVVADIYENDLPFVKIGQKATINLSNFSGRKIASTIDYLYPLLSGDTRTVKARFTIANPQGELKPQMFTEVEIFIDLGKRLALPEAAVINTGTRQMVYLDKGDGVFEPRDVTTGIRAEGLIEITAGVEPGEKVASQANFLIDSEARLKGVVQ